MGLLKKNKNKLSLINIILSFKTFFSFFAILKTELLTCSSRRTDTLKIFIKVHTRRKLNKIS